MPTRIFTILGRLRQDAAAAISPRTIEAACEKAGYRWRARKLGPVETISLFLLQVLLRNASCRHVERLGGQEFSDSAYCQARRRIRLAVFLGLVEGVAAAVRAGEKGPAKRGRC
ncbi:hypothetical protein [Paludisphaera rhizosphaerae]|uniref:hypothetical protein n=1 Tax=Paludisphaera rhizosphaerae TaxID=2711216 RepID=UPI0013EA6DFA|nr:hypothetical protein [Paludisphaera rhizosphaerae]